MGCGCSASRTGTIVLRAAAEPPQKTEQGPLDKYGPNGVPGPYVLERWTIGGTIAHGHHSTFRELRPRDEPGAAELPFQVCVKVIRHRPEEDKNIVRVSKVHSGSLAPALSSTRCSTLDEVPDARFRTGDSRGECRADVTKDSPPFLDEQKTVEFDRVLLGPIVHPAFKSTRREGEDLSGSNGRSDSTAPHRDSSSASACSNHSTHSSIKLDLRSNRSLADPTPAAHTRLQSLNEVSLMERAHHPNIVQMLEWFQDDDAVYLVVQRCYGNLWQRFQHGVPDNLAAKYHCQLASAVKHLHNSYIIHGDIKPEHIMCSSKKEDFDIALGDLRIAQKVVDEEDTVKAHVATPTYSAPECLAEHTQSLASDIWACGCVLFWMHMGESPFQVAPAAAPGGAGARSPPSSAPNLRPAPVCSRLDGEDWEVALRQLPRAICSPSEAARKLGTRDKTKEKLIELVRGMLKVRPDVRMTAEEVVFHPWTVGASKRLFASAVDDDFPPVAKKSSRLAPTSLRGVGKSSKTAKMEAGVTPSVSLPPVRGAPTALLC